MKIAKSAHFHARFGGRPGWSGPAGIVVFYLTRRIGRVIVLIPDGPVITMRQR
jgi:hypothetical protein